MFEGPLYLVGPTAATLIIDAYQDARLPLKDGARPGSTARARVYARSPLLWPENLGEPVYVNVPGQLAISGDAGREDPIGTHPL